MTLPHYPETQPWTTDRLACRLIQEVARRQRARRRPMWRSALAAAAFSLLAALAVVVT